MKQPLIIKVCGLRQADNIRQVAALGVQWIGLIFSEKSPRCVTMIPTHAGIMPDRAGLSPHQAPPSALRVGVFVDEMPQNIITRVVTYGLDIVQLHGHETPTLLRNLRATLASDLRPGLRIMKAISLSDAEDLQACAQYEQCADLFLFDTKCCNAGGSGRHFDWSLLDDYKGSLPYLLSGGIGPGDAEDINRFLATHPQCIGIDLNSRFETEPGVKDVEALRQFISQLSVQPHTQTDTTV